MGSSWTSGSWIDAFTRAFPLIAVRTNACCAITTSTSRTAVCHRTPHLETVILVRTCNQPPVLHYHPGLQHDTHTTQPRCNHASLHGSKHVPAASACVADPPLQPIATVQYMTRCTTPLSQTTDPRFSGICDVSPTSTSAHAHTTCTTRTTRPQQQQHISVPAPFASLVSACWSRCSLEVNTFCSMTSHALQTPVQVGLPRSPTSSNRSRVAVSHRPGTLG